MNSTVNTAAGGGSSATYLYLIYSLSSAPSNNGTSYLLQYDTTTRLTESFGSIQTYGSRNFTRFIVISTSAPTLFFSVTFGYTVSGATQPQINSSPVSFMRVG